MRSSMPLSTGLKKCAKRKMKGPGQSGSWKEEERRREKEFEGTFVSKTSQVSAPLILDPALEEMLKEMKNVCKDLEKVTG